MFAAARLLTASIRLPTYSLVTLAHPQRVDPTLDKSGPVPDV
ncbi:hypothetical protein QP400_10370 [Winkia sp. UMB3158]|nr:MULTISPECIES: hypothetical protein [Winkia]MDK8341816.1 hypothetical protein [Winkia sp. UMB3164B]MDK8596045.1 hypothetical protein [Winkia sp. UMB1096A]MDK6240210.1 hypothetical protein [Winkia sp. UMB10116]MDK7150519.1 hypothetical protein [Winkia sp. UMB3158]MDK8565637.1 hypothetical protein [Winkia sp. UMB3164A]